MKEVRPTTGKALSALFNILGPLEGRSFLDLFSGSGKVALSAYERGAYPVCLVESDRYRFLNIVKTVPDDVECLCIDVRRACSMFVKKEKSFDVVFADPPYGLGWGNELPRLIMRYSGIVSSDGLFVFEHSEKEPADMIRGWHTERRAYGSTVLTFYRRRADR